MKREGFVFYRSFAEAYRELSTPEDKLAFINSVVDYGLDGIEPKTKGITRLLFNLIRPQIDANNKRYMNGKKGGKPTEEKSLDERFDEAMENRNKTKA